MAQKKETPYVVLVSFDGFRYDYVKNFDPPHFQTFIKKGAQAEALIPSFPSKTFPNHYTLVTGLLPGHHGLVDNYFFDRERATKYSMRERQKVTDPYYYGGIPIWQLARQHGLKSASYFWVGSEMSDENRRPDYYYPFNDSEDPYLRVKQVLDWLRLPEAERPHLITLYFSSPDHEGHDFGPNAPETKQAVLRADSLLGSLMEGLSAIDLPVNVILVSDHGMKELTMAEETFIFLDELFDKKDTSMVVVNGGTQAHIYFKDEQKKAAVFASLKAREKNFVVWQKEHFPTDWNFQSPRAGDLLIAAKPGYYMREGGRENFRRYINPEKKFGVHGYDPARETDMRGIFYAQGPNIKAGKVVPPFQNIHIYPLMAYLLGLPLPPIDGKWDVLQGIYQK